ncbi:MAG: MFS transporter [Clostridiales bacterium]|nr:MFS transporter [Clostridiales bacterium]
MTRKPMFALKLATFVIALGYSLILPVMPFYMENLGAGGRELGWLTAVYALTQTICAPFWGALSDRIGRKPVIGVGMIGYAVSLFLFGLASSFWALFIARSLSGILSSASSAASLAYVGDCSIEEERSANMGRLGAAMSVGVIIGPLIGGALAAYSLALPFFVGAGAAMVAFVLIVTLLPESLERSVLSNKKGSLNITYIKTTLLGPAGIILIIIFAAHFCQTGLQGVTGLYVVEKFGFTAGQVGILWMVVAGVLIVIQVFLTGPLEKRMGDKVLILTGMIGKALVSLSVIFAAGFAGMLAVMGLFAATSAITVPTLNASLSKVADQQKGTLMGLASMTGNLSKVIAPLLSGYIYDSNIDLPYIAMAAVALIGAIMCVVWRRYENQVSTGSTFLKEGESHE